MKFVLRTTIWPKLIPTRDELGNDCFRFEVIEKIKSAGFEIKKETITTKTHFLPLDEQEESHHDFLTIEIKNLEDCA